jgi:hypothetical protein
LIDWAKLESGFDAWERGLSESIQIKGKYIPSGGSISLGENPYSHRQCEMKKRTGRPRNCN